MREEVFTYMSSNDLHMISAKIWKPENEESIIGILQIVHGMTEHKGRYEVFAKYLVERGFLVCMNDHAGHGESIEDLYGYMGGEHGHLFMVQDVRNLFLNIREEYKTVPYFLLGHSMGSFVARFYTEQFGDELQGVLYSGTGDKPAGLDFAILFSDAVIRVGGGKRPGKFFERLLLKAYNKRFEPTRTLSDWISRDEDMVDVYRKDKLCTFTFTYCGYRDLFILLREVSRRDWAENVPKKLPIFIFSGTEDPVGDFTEGVKNVYNSLLQAKCEDISLKLYEGGRHEMLNETNRLEVYEDIYRWLSMYKDTKKGNILEKQNS